MEIIKCNLGYDIEVDYDFKDALGGVLKEENIFIITDTNLFKYYELSFNLKKFQSQNRLYVIKAGEASKQLRVAGLICEKMIVAGCNRKTTVVAFGGGVVGDLAGFISSIFMRGVPFLQIPTSLLAQVDSSVGGKTAVDAGNYKNMIGAFKQPKQVLACVNFLKTLNMREFRSGLGEIVKTALLDKNIYEKFTANLPRILASDIDTIFDIVVDCIKFKCRIVERDEFETGVRKHLNLGHTIGHGIEAAHNHKLSHGEYVLNGIWYELQIAKWQNVVDQTYAKKVQNLVETILDGLILPIKDVERVMRFIMADKKNTDGLVVCILPKDVGEVEVKSFTRDEFEGLVYKLQKA